MNQIHRVTIWRSSCSMFNTRIYRVENEVVQKRTRLWYIYVETQLKQNKQPSDAVRVKPLAIKPPGKRGRPKVKKPPKEPKVDNTKKKKRSKLFDIFSLDRSIGGLETSSDATIPSQESHVASYVKYQSPYHLMAAKEGSETKKTESRFKSTLPGANKTAQLARKLAYEVWPAKTLPPTQSAFSIYLMEGQHPTAEENFDNSKGAFMLTASKNWKNLSANEKKYYREKSRQMKHQRRIAMKEWLSSFTSTQLNEMNRMIRLRNYLHEGKNLRQRVLSTEQPKRPPSAYFMYLNKARDNATNIRLHSAFNVKSAEGWWSMSSKEREVNYYAKADELMKTFIVRQRDFRQHQTRKYVEELLQREKEYC
ncbi:hypothetical protein BDF22DRAFT_662410 [Syncephalis plumigaleata]|nr:hypothetical protein BDF22DRAFT_662410 [Syncephalis plumigaleata]